ncbi:MAG TPA: hypothetical protein VIS72_08760, partial [Anaerolineales bacterium]
ENSPIKDIGRSYIVSSMLPAAFFITLGAFIYRAFIPETFTTPLVGDKYSASLLLLYSALIMWVGFALYSMVNWIVRFYEGYYLFGWIKWILVRLFCMPEYRRKTKFIKKVLDAKKKRVDGWEKVFEEYYNQAWSDYSDAELSFPLREDDLMPTRLGNVLRASEQYPEKYGLLAGISLWPRLSTLLPQNMANQLEETNNHFIFLLNSSFLSYVNGLIGLLVLGICYIFQCCSVGIVSVNPLFGIHVPLSSLISLFSKEEFLIVVFGWFLFGYILYLFSIPVAKTFGLLIRSSYDLYRFDLLKQLNYRIPRSLLQEKKDWVKISDFVVTGGSLGSQPLDFKYNLRSEFTNNKRQSRNSRSRNSSKFNR